MSTDFIAAIKIIGLATPHLSNRAEIARLVACETSSATIEKLNNGLEVSNAIKSNTFDLILMDYQFIYDERKHLLFFNSIESKTKLVAIGELVNGFHFWQLLELGIRGFIGPADHGDLPRAFHIVFEGGIFLSDGIVRSIKSTPVNEKFDEELSDFEIKLLKELATGKSSTELGNMFLKSPRTIEKYRNSIYAKLRVDNKEQLIAKASRLLLL